jgi:hypothetical protein
MRRYKKKKAITRGDSDTARDDADKQDDEEVGDQTTKTKQTDDEMALESINAN